MKNLSIILFVSVFFFGACKKDNTTSLYKQETISLGTGSASDAYYSFANGQVKTVNRADWDIAFTTSVQSASIFVNEGAGDELYCVGDTNAWSTFTDFNPGDYTLHLNDKSGWVTGAFNLYPNSPFSFGWGTYNMAVHNVIGDSIYVIKPVSGPYKKLFIRERIGTTSQYVLRWANIDGSDQVDTTISIADFAAKNLVMFSLVNKQILDAEPDINQWDLIFTRYLVPFPTGTGTNVNHLVTGVLSNPGVKIAKILGIPPTVAVLADTTTGFSSHADVIGYDWKDENFVTSAVTLVDTLSYFVKSVDGKTYQLYFTGYGGTNAGTISIKTKLVE